MNWPRERVQTADFSSVCPSSERMMTFSRHAIKNKAVLCGVVPRVRIFVILITVKTVTRKTKGLGHFTALTKAFRRNVK